MAIVAGTVSIPGPVKIHEDADMWVSDDLYIGPHTVIKKGFKVRCRSLHIGTHCYIHENIEIGFGGCMGPNAHVYIDDYVGIFYGTRINCAEPVHIGKYCGIGDMINIWTHGSWLPVVEGFPPQKQGPVWIGDKVWLPSRCQILAGVTIGDNVVCGAGTLINKDLPGGCFAAGVPAKVKAENVYPKPLTADELMVMGEVLRDQYLIIAEDKGFKPDIDIRAAIVTDYPELDSTYLWFKYQDELVGFNLQHPELTDLHDISECAEDFRDFLRRNGFKFYNGGFFRSMLPLRFAR